MTENKENNDNILFYGKVAKLPKNSKASTAISFLEKIKISKQKLWYLIVEKQDNELQMIKYNNRQGFNLKSFLEKLKSYYSHDQRICEYIDNLEIDGNEMFSMIKNIPDIEIDGRKLITIIMEDLIRLLH